MTRTWDGHPGMHIFKPPKELKVRNELVVPENYHNADRIEAQIAEITNQQLEAYIIEKKRAVLRAMRGLPICPCGALTELTHETNRSSLMIWIACPNLLKHDLS